MILDMRQREENGSRDGTGYIRAPNGRAIQPASHCWDSLGTPRRRLPSALGWKLVCVCVCVCVLLIVRLALRHLAMRPRSLGPAPLCCEMGSCCTSL